MSVTALVSARKLAREAVCSGGSRNRLEGGDMKKTKTSTVAPRSKTAITTTVRQPDPEVVVRKVRDDWQALLPQQRILNANRAYAELVDLANTPSGLDPVWKTERTKALLEAIKWKFHLPQFITFYPRNSVPAGAFNKPFDEDPFSNVYYTPKSGHSDAPGANGYGAFDANTGVFQSVAVSTGNQVVVEVGPRVIIETTNPVDAVITAQAIIDWQYVVSSSLNPAFVPSPYAGLGLVDIEISLKPLVSCVDKTTLKDISVIGPFGAKQLRDVSYDFNLSDAPGTTPSGHETRIGRSGQESAIGLPITFQSEVLVPANARCEIGTVVYIKAFAVGGTGDTEWQYLAYGDARASGRFLSVEVDMYD